MPERRNNWYNLHSTRRYPLDDKATGTDDDGVRLKDDIINDLHLRFPLDAGRFAFLSGLTVTDRLVTAIFVACDDVENPTKLTPIAAVHAVKPVTEGLHVAVRPLYDQVGGFVVFGDTTENGIFRFSSPVQGLVAARAARAFNRLPIPSVRRLTNATGLQGLVTLRGRTDVEVVAEDVFIPGHGDQSALVVRLVQSPIGDNVLEKYIGPCGARPESRNCEKTPIETINGAVPDCDGNIDILFCQLETAPFQSCGLNENPGGVIIDGSIGIDEVCAGQQPERFAGRDQCVPLLSSSSSSLSSLSLPSIPLPSASSISSGGPAPVCADLPYCENFDDGLAQFFEIKNGSFAISNVDSPAESCASLQSLTSFFSSSVSSLSSLSSLSSRNSLSSRSSRSSRSSISSISSRSCQSASLASLSSSSISCDALVGEKLVKYDQNVRYTQNVKYTQNVNYQLEVVAPDTKEVPYTESIEKSYRSTGDFLRNVAVWDACAYSTSLDKVVTTDLRLNSGAQENGGIVINWHIVDQLTNPHQEYFHALLDRRQNAVRLLFFTGVSPIVEIARVQLGSQAVIGHWYRMKVTIQEILDPSIAIQIEVTGVTQPAWPKVTLTVPTSQFLPDDGLYGLGSVRGVTDFSFFSIRERV